MFKNSLRVRLLLFILLISIIPLAFIGYTGYLNTKKYIMEKEEEKIHFFLKNNKGEMVKFFSNTKNDLQFLKGVTEEELLYLDRDLNGVHKKELENIYWNFSNNNIQYDQIRFIDKDGYEVIRVNNIEGKSYIVPQEELQYKGDRYYFKEALSLRNEEIYISEVDLNQENGEIEKPIKPMVRYVIPAYSHNKLRGFLVLNLNIQYLLKNIEVSTLQNGYENMIILDDEGYYIKHPDKEKEWGSPKDLNTEENLINDYPDLAQEILSSEGLKIKSVKENIIAWYPVELECLNNKKVIVFFDLAKEKYLQPLVKFRNLFIIEILFTILILVIGVIIISNYLTKPILKIVKAVDNIGKGDFDVRLDINTNDELQLLSYEIKKMTYELKDMYRNMEKLVDERTKELQIAHSKLKEMATKDSLTGLYNRHYFNQYIQSIANDVENNGRNMMILIIDVDKFKYINDNYGHNVGDKVLKAIAKLLSDSTRKSDITVRYGGDEFLVALCDSGIEIAQKYIDRVKKSLDEWNLKNNILEHELTLSIGYDEYSGDKHILEAINNADKMMYDNKMAKRKKEKE